MTFSPSIGHSVFAKILISKTTDGIRDLNSDSTTVDFRSYFLDPDNIIEMNSIRDMPQFGVPANIVKVNEFGIAVSKSIQVQADAPDLEFTLNLVPQDFDSATTSGIGSIVGDNTTRLICVNGLSSELNNSTLRNAVGSVDNWQMFFLGRVESRLVSPMRDDATQVTLAMSSQSDFWGLRTVNEIAYAADKFYKIHSERDTKPGGTYVIGTTKPVPTKASPYVWEGDAAEPTTETLHGIGW